MKKQMIIKTILLAVTAVLTVVLFIMAVVMLKAVKGDALFYMDSVQGYFYAVSYRWVCLAEGLLLLFWMILGVDKRKDILSKLSRVKWKRKGTGEVTVQAAAGIKSSSVAAEPVTIFCIGCGKQIPADAKFCPFCGTSTKQ